MGSSGSTQSVSKMDIDPDIKGRQLALYGDTLGFQAQNPYQPYTGPRVAGPSDLGQAGTNYLTQAIFGAGSPQFGWQAPQGLPTPGQINVPQTETRDGFWRPDPVAGGANPYNGGTAGTPTNPPNTGNPDDQTNWDPMRATVSGYAPQNSTMLGGGFTTTGGQGGFVPPTSFPGNGTPGGVFDPFSTGGNTGGPATPTGDWFDDWINSGGGRTDPAGGGQIPIGGAWDGSTPQTDPNWRDKIEVMIDNGTYAPTGGYYGMGGDTGTKNIPFGPPVSEGNPIVTGSQDTYSPTQGAGVGFSELADATAATRGMLGQGLGMITPQQVQGQGIGFQQVQAGAPGSGQIGSEGQALSSAARAGVRDVNAAKMGDLSQYTNPYTNDVVDASISDIQRAADLQRNTDQARIAAAGAFGNSRRGLVEGETNRAELDAIGRTSAQLRSAGFGQAAQLAQQDLQRAQQASQLNQGADLATVGQGFNIASQYGLSGMDAGLRAQLANQQAGLTAGQANQRTSLTADLANQSAGLQAGQLNQSGTLQNRQQQLAAAGQLAGFGAQNQGMTFQAGDVLNRLGQQQQGLSQSVLDANYAQFYDPRNAAIQDLAMRQGILSGVPVGSTTTNTQPRQGSTLGTALGLGGTFLGGLGGFLGAL